MMLKEKETPNAVSFNVDIKRTTSSDNPALRKRLEQESEAAQAPITMDMI